LDPHLLLEGEETSQRDPDGIEANKAADCAKFGLSHSSDNPLLNFLCEVEDRGDGDDIFDGIDGYELDLRDISEVRHNEFPPKEDDAHDDCSLCQPIGLHHYLVLPG